MTQRLGLICLALGLLAIFVDTTDAQIRILQRSNRAFGHWTGPGYHKCNPGPNSSYYNPWTRHNSLLISRTPEFQSRFGHEIHRTPVEMLYSNQSVYGQPQMMAPQYYPGSTPMNADFVPSRSATDDEFDDLDDDTEFEAIEDEDVEDRFDREVDEMEDSDGPFSDEPGGIDSDGQDSSSDEDASVLLTPGGAFQPASYPLIGN